MWGFGQEVYSEIMNASMFFSVTPRRLDESILKRTYGQGTVKNDYSSILFPMKVWLFFSVALLVYGFAFESTFAKDKSPTIATLGAALVAGSLMWVVWRIN